MSLGDSKFKKYQIWLQNNAIKNTKNLAIVRYCKGLRILIEIYEE